MFFHDFHNILTMTSHRSLILVTKMCVFFRRRRPATSPTSRAWPWRTPATTDWAWTSCPPMRPRSRSPVASSDRFVELGGLIFFQFFLFPNHEFGCYFLNLGWRVDLPPTRPLTPKKLPISGDEAEGIEERPLGHAGLRWRHHPGDPDGQRLPLALCQQGRTVGRSRWRLWDFGAKFGANSCKRNNWINKHLVCATLVQNLGMYANQKVPQNLDFDQKAQKNSWRVFLKLMPQVELKNSLNSCHTRRSPALAVQSRPWWEVGAVLIIFGPSWG